MITSFTQPTAHQTLLSEISQTHAVKGTVWHFIITFSPVLFLEKKKKQNKKPHPTPLNPKTPSLCDHPVITAPGYLQQPRAGCCGPRCGLSTVGGNLGVQELLKVIFSTCENATFNLPINPLASSVFHTKNFHYLKS